jgi:urease accessory protein
MTTLLPLADALSPAPAGETRPPGQSGSLDVTAERIADRTRITELRCRAPLQALRPHYVDPALPDMAFLTIASPAGGVLQGDRLELRVRLGADARLHLDTQGATRLYRAPLVVAEQSTAIALGPGAYLEYLPDPYIPYAGSRFRARTECLVAEDATLILSEIVTAGREAHGERHRFESFASRLLISRLGGELVAADAVMLDRRETIAAPGRLGGYTVVGTLVVVHPGFAPETLRPALADIPGRPALAGASSLPGDAGAWLRVLAGSAADAADVLGAAFALARIAILGAGPPPTRRA